MASKKRDPLSIQLTPREQRNASRAVRMWDKKTPYKVSTWKSGRRAIILSGIRRVNNGNKA